MSTQTTIAAPAPGHDDPSYPEMLACIARVVREHVAAHVPPADAASIGFAAAEAVRHEFGGQQVYVPQGLHYALAQRDRDIYAAWRPPANTAEICRQYGISERHLYRIASAVRAEEMARKQMRLVD